jgi:prevent-host-death family protein
MRTFSAQDLQQQSGEIQRAAVSAPVVIMNHGKPRSVVMSVDEFRRLKAKSGEKVPEELDRPRPVVRRVPMRDPLGYSTSDIRSLALAMADAAMSGRNKEAVRAEIETVERRLGLRLSTIGSRPPRISAVRAS